MFERLISTGSLRFLCVLCVSAVQFVAPADEPRSRVERVERVESIGMTVADLDRAVAFFTDVLTFEKVAETKLSGDEFGKLQGLSSPKARAARLKLGDEFIELTEYESPKGRAFPEDSRSNDRWFQHVAIIVSDMEKAHAG